MMRFMAMKSFNPMNQENQKKKFIAEQKEKQRIQKEQERQKLLQRERNRESLFTAGELQDPKHSQVGFMYQPPPGFVDTVDKEAEEAHRAGDPSQPECARNAPTEGTYTTELELRPKPFGKLYCRRKCIRCGEIGHLTGARECPMKDALPVNDGDTKAMEDPLLQMKSRLGANDDRLVMKEHLLTTKIGTREEDHELVPSDDEDIDVEEDMLDSLTSKEKRRLRKYLKKQARKEEKERRRLEKEARRAMQAMAREQDEWVEAENVSAKEESPREVGSKRRRSRSPSGSKHRRKDSRHRSDSRSPSSRSSRSSRRHRSRSRSPSWRSRHSHRREHSRERRRRRDSRSPERKRRRS
mmetsp:Transcript_7190/g.30629  ORF Transcript_7190/g.30629 Transcript_7190/m.30629 type:complete len:354 (-) Transcript_7190:55-1116(-)